MIKWKEEEELLTGSVLPLATLERPVDLDRVSHPVKKKDRKRLRMIVVRELLAGWAVSKLQESLHWQNGTSAAKDASQDIPAN